MTTSNLRYESSSVTRKDEKHCLAKSINDVSWYQFRIWIEYFGKVFKKVTVAVNPQYTSLECSNCGEIVKKSLSTRTHISRCGCIMDRDFNAARNILLHGLGTTGHTGTFVRDVSNAWGDEISTPVGESLQEPSHVIDPRISVATLLYERLRQRERQGRTA